MANLTSRYKAAFLAVTMVTSGCVSAEYTNPFSQITAYVPNQRQVAALAVLAGVAAKIRLSTKGTKFDYKASDWSDDVKTLLNSYNIFDIQTYKTVAGLVDKWVVGRRFKKIELTVRTKKDGAIETTKDIKIVSTPFGAMGLLDAFVLSQMKDVCGSLGALAVFIALINNPMGSFLGSAMSKGASSDTTE